MKEKKNIILSIFILLTLPLQMFPCLILKITHGDCVLVSNNEVVNIPLPKIWFEQPEEGNKEMYHEEKSNFYSIDVILSFDWYFSIAGEIKRFPGS